MDSTGPRPDRDTDAEARRHDILLRLRMAGVSAAVMTEARVRMDANLARGASWATSRIPGPGYHDPNREPVPRCDCGADLVGAGWQGEVAVDCGECSSRWHLRVKPGGFLVLAVSGPSQEWLDAERPRPVPVDGAEPGQRRGVAVEHGDEPAFRRHGGEQAFDVAQRSAVAALADVLRPHNRHRVVPKQPHQRRVVAQGQVAG